MKYCFVAYFFATVHISCFRSFPILSCSKEALISSPTRKILRNKFVLSHSSSLVDVRQVDPEIVKLKWATVDFDVPTSLKDCLNKFFKHPSSVIISTILFAIVGARLQMNSAISTIEIFSGVATTIFWSDNFRLEVLFAHAFISYKYYVGSHKNGSCISTCFTSH